MRCRKEMRAMLYIVTEKILSTRVHLKVQTQIIFARLIIMIKGIQVPHNIFLY